MRQFCRYALIGMVCCAGFSCSHWKRWTRSETIPTRSAGGTSEQQIFNGINQYRATRGKPALVRNAGLDAQARKHAQAMARGRTMNHGHLSARAFEARSHGFPQLAENVGHASGSSGGGAYLVSLWVNSSPHRKNLLGNWSGTGIGVATASNGDIYATQEFAR